MDENAVSKYVRLSQDTSDFNSVDAAKTTLYLAKQIGDVFEYT